MSFNKTYAVLGLGRYGSAVARELVESGAEVLAVDCIPENVNAAARFLPVCKCADVSNPEAVYQLGLANMDVVIVSMASNLEASVLAVTLCKEAGVPRIIAKCANETHRKILLRVGADQVVFPEQESGIRLARSLLSQGLLDMIELSRQVSMVTLELPAQWVGSSLAQLNLRQAYGLNVVALRRGEQVTAALDPHASLEAGCQLLVIADTDQLKSLHF